MEASITKGKKAITNYRTIEVFENNKIPTFSLLECQLETGRTHQIRVHLSNKGNNIVGDQHYKRKNRILKNISIDLEKRILDLKRQFLHARYLKLIHPKTNKKIEFNSKLPRELNILLKTLRNT